MRASNARPYGIACTSDEDVGATIGRPLLAAGAMRLEIVEYIYSVDPKLLFSQNRCCFALQ